MRYLALPALFAIMTLSASAEPIDTCRPLVPDGLAKQIAEYGPGPFWGESAPRRNELKTIKSSHEGVVTGMLESTAIYYFRLNGRWRFVWISD